jgi:G protein beta subunit-like protein
MIVLVTGGFDHKLRFWEATSGVNSKTLKFPGESQINCVAISVDKSLIVAGGNPQIHLYETSSNADAPLVTFEGHTSSVTAVGFQKDGKWIYSASEDGSVRIWDPRTPVCQRTYEGAAAQSPAVNALALHPNQTDLIAGDQSGCLKIWDLEASCCSYRHAPIPDVPVRSISIVRMRIAHQLLLANIAALCDRPAMPPWWQ